MLLSSKGIVLQSIKYGDSSLITKIVSEEKGLISIISNRSKNKKSKTANYLQPLNPILFVCYFSTKSNIHRLKEISFDKDYVSTDGNVVADSIRFFLAEFLSCVIKEEEQNFSLFSFLHQKTIELSNSNNSDLADFHIRFLIEFLDLLGIYPILDAEHHFFDLEEGVTSLKTPRHDNYYDKDQYSLLLNYHELGGSFNKTQRKILLDMLIDYYNIQLGGGLKNMKSKEVLEVVFS